MAASAPSELPNGGGLPAGVNPEDPNVVIENLGDGANDILDSIIGGLGGILGSLFLTLAATVVVRMKSHLQYAVISLI